MLFHSVKIVCLYLHTHIHSWEFSNSPGWGPREAALLHLQDKLCGSLGAPRLCPAVSVLQALACPFGNRPSHLAQRLSWVTSTSQGCSLHGNSCHKSSAGRNLNENRWALTEKWDITGCLRAGKGQSLCCVPSLFVPMPGWWRGETSCYLAMQDMTEHLAGLRQGETPLTPSWTQGICQWAPTCLGELIRSICWEP